MALRIAVVLALVVLLINIVTFGGIGELLFAVGDGIAIAIFGSALGEIHGDYRWPIAIWMGLVWPVGALLLFYSVVWLRRSKRRPLWNFSLFALYLLALDVGLSVVFHMGAASLSPQFEIEERQAIP